ncbi:MAG TPA: alpha/beta hydrolase, partial [Mycobacterium sp.]|nr:alpha/beta hydrolase [Mycobacterium sp.]
MPYGRLADPESTLGTDPRSDPRMVKAFAQFGLDGPAPDIALTVDSPLEDRRAFAAMNEDAIEA